MLRRLPRGYFDNLGDEKAEGGKAPGPPMDEEANPTTVQRVAGAASQVKQVSTVANTLFTPIFKDTS